MSVRCDPVSSDKGEHGSSPPLPQRELIFCSLPLFPLCVESLGPYSGQRISSQKGAGADGQLSALQAEMTASALQSGNAGDLDGEEMASDASDEED